MEPIGKLIFTTSRFTLLNAMKELYPWIIEVEWKVTMHAQGVGSVGDVVGPLFSFYIKVGTIMGRLWKADSVTKKIQSILYRRHFLHQADPILLECCNGFEILSHVQDSIDHHNLTEEKFVEHFIIVHELFILITLDIVVALPQFRVWSRLIKFPLFNCRTCK